ncbi:MAG: DUF1294 domain-containing protein [Pygmaiobacter massiliensis]|nr:DUF1294 domain-containing protein [Pygmaiobacter massiliensis]
MPFYLLFFKIMAGGVLLVNLLAFLLCGLDKWKARHAKRRIRERSLLLLAVFFGAAGLFLGMLLFHHKTRDRAFMPWVPLILAAQVFFGVWLIGRFLVPAFWAAQTLA